MFAFRSADATDSVADIGAILPVVSNDDTIGVAISAAVYRAFLKEGFIDQVCGDRPQRGPGGLVSYDVLDSRVQRRMKGPRGGRVKEGIEWVKLVGDLTFSDFPRKGEFYSAGGISFDEVGFSIVVEASSICKELDAPGEAAMEGPKSNRREIWVPFTREMVARKDKSSCCQGDETTFNWDM